MSTGIGTVATVVLRASLKDETATGNAGSGLVTGRGNAVRSIALGPSSIGDEAGDALVAKMFFDKDSSLTGKMIDCTLTGTTGAGVILGNTDSSIAFWPTRIGNDDREAVKSNIG